TCRSSDISENTTGSRNTSRLVRSANAKPAPREINRMPVKIGRPVAVNTKLPANRTGRTSRRRAGMLSVRALATRRGNKHAPSASTQPTTTCSASLIVRSRRVDLEAVATQDRVPYESGRDIAELQTEHQRPRKSDAPPPAIDAALDDPSRAVAAEQKRRRPVEPIGHRRIEEARTNYGHTDAGTL